MKGFATVLSLSVLSLAGCGMGVVGGSSSPVGTATGAITLQGVVHGGQQPVTLSTVTLWTVGTTGYASTPTQVTSTATDGSGGFTLPGYTCSPASELVYITATGGSPGASNPVNSQIFLMAALGPCSLLTATTNVVINEVTTVASVYALAQFMNFSTGGVGYPSASPVGIANAFATVNNLVNVSNGNALLYTPAGNGLAPQAEVNTLANLLALCVNSTGGTAGQNNNCGSLFTDTTHASNVPANTLQAILNIALHPADNPSGQWGLVTTGGPFQPTLPGPGAPSDWTMPVLYAGVGIATVDLAVDASGNIWMANAGGNGNGSISEISNLGQVTGTYEQNKDGLDAIAIDLGGNAWAANYSTGQIFELAPGSTPIGPISFQETANPQAVAVDGNNNVWITNTGSNSVTEIRNQGPSSTAISPLGGFVGGNLNSPVGVAMDAAGDAWVADSASNSLTKISPNGTVSAQPGSNLFNPSGIAVDASGDLWVTNAGVNSSNVSPIVEFNNAGTQTATYSAGTSLFSGGSFDAVDGGNHIWVANELNNSISELSASGTALSPAAGFLGPNVKVSATSYSGAAMPAPFEVRIDPSGNVWVPNLNGVPIGVGGSNAMLTELVGLATPTVQPLALAAQQGLIGQLPGTSPGTALVVTTSSLPSSVQTANYSVQLLAKGGTGNGYTWQVTSGASTLSSVGLSLSSSGLLSGKLSGTVSGASIGFKVTDSGGATATATLSLTVSAVSALSITTSSIAGATVGTNYNQTFTATGGSGSYTWSIPGGTQLTALNNEGLGYGPSGTLGGTPTAPGSFPFTMQVTDLATAQTVSRQFTLVVTNATLSQCTHDGTGNAILNGHYAFLLTGFDSSGNVLDQIGSFQANGMGTISSGMVDFNDSGNTTSGEESYTFTGTYSIGSTDNRGQMVVNASNNANPQYYCFVADGVTNNVATSGRVIDASGDGSIQTGVFQIQNSADFSNSGLTGGYVFGVQGVKAGSPLPREMTAGQVTLTGSGGISSGQVDYYNGANSSPYLGDIPATTGGSYSVGAGGRGTMTINLSNQGSTISAPFVIYQFGNGTGFFMLTSGNISGSVGLEAGYAVQQTLTTFTAASVAGAGVFRSDTPVGDAGSGSTGYIGNGLADEDSIGQLTFSGGGAAAIVYDQNSAGTLTTPASGTGSGNFTVVSPGYLTLQNAGNQAPNFYLYAAGGGFGMDSGGGFWVMVPQTIPSGGFTGASLSGAYGVGSVSPLGYSSNGTPLAGGPYPNVFIATGTFGSGTIGLVQDSDYAPGITADVTTGQVSSGGTWVLDSTTYGSSTFGAAAGRFTIATGDSGTTVGYIVSPTQAFILTEKSGHDPQMFIADHQ